MHKQEQNASKQADELNETDSEKTFRKFQREIAKLQNLALNTKEQKPIIESLTKTADNAFWDEELKLKIDNLNVQWSDFTKGIDIWKLKIETKIKKSKEYENVITRAEELVGELHKKTQDEYDSGEVVKLADELQRLRSRVTKLESIISELHAVENLEEKFDDSLQNSVHSNEPMRSSTPKKQQRATEENNSEIERKDDVYNGFDTLRIVKTICDKELEFTERKLEKHKNNNQVKIHQLVVKLNFAKMAVRSEAESAERSFASKIKISYIFDVKLRITLYFSLCMSFFAMQYQLI